MPASTMPAKRDVTIRIRARADQRDLIDRAAARLGERRSDFILEAACHEAESILLDQRLFPLDAPAWQKFLAMLDTPPHPTEGLRDLMSTRAPWDQ